MNHEDILFTVTKTGNYGKSNLGVWVFRTRDAARGYARAKKKLNKTFAVNYVVGRAKWGPEA